MFLIYPLNEKDKKIKAALKGKKEAVLQRQAKNLIEKGADCLDLCFSKEKDLFFALDALAGTKIKISIDTQDKNLLYKVLKRQQTFLINSSYPDRESLSFSLKLAREFNTSLVVLSIPKKKKGLNLPARREVVNEVVRLSELNKLPLEKLFIDVIILPFKYYPEYLYLPLSLSKYIKAHFPSVKKIAGLDNFTYRRNNLLLKRFYYRALSPYIDAVISKETGVFK